jgi:penicillin-binding protein 2
MLRDIRKNKIFNRRVFILGIGQSILTSFLLLRLGYLQIWKHNQYSIQADSNRIRALINPAPRGIIFDRHGLPLAKNESNFRLLIYLGKKHNLNQTIDKLSEILDLTEQQKQGFYNKIKAGKRKNVVSLIDNLNWHDLAKIESSSHLLPAISIESGIIRKYPYPYETAHFLGYVSLPSEKQIEKLPTDNLTAENNKNLFMHPDFRIGSFGIEKTFDNALRGEYGIKYVEVNVHEVPLRTLDYKQYNEGSRINLTINFNLQKFVTARIKNDSASAVVIDVKTGEILAYASSPSFDPNNFVEGVSKEYWQQLTSDPKKPLNNKPISALYAPGSTFKLMVALAALENGYNPNNYVFCNGSYQLGKRTFHCWKEGGHGSLNLTDAIMHSCNTYFFTIANQIGYEKIIEMAKKFGYAEKFDISLSGVKAGLLPTEDWKQKVFKEPWVKGDTLNTAIGQGNVLASPLQMAIITARIANGGIPIKPYLIRNNNIFKQFDALQNQPLINKQHLKIVQEGMKKVVNQPGGTAYGKRIELTGFEMAGKTGTSQVISKREREMTKEETIAYANHAIFVGYAPIHDPQYAIAVVVEHGKSGSMAAAPIAKDILMQAQGINDKQNSE